MNRRGYRVTILTPHVTGSATHEVLRGVSIRRFRYLPTASAETLGLDGGMLPGLRRRRFDILKVPALLWAQHRALGSLHRDDPIDILHTHWLIPQGVIGGRFANRKDVPHVATAHGSDVLGLGFPGIAPVLRFAAARSDLITVNSEAMESELRARIGKHHTVVIPIGAQIPEPETVTGNRDLRRSLPESDHVAGFVGRVVREKGVLEFIKIIELLRQREVSVTGLVVGGGSAEDSARALVEDLGLAETVRFEGPVEPRDVVRYMSVMDILLVPSHYEAQGIVAIEAMLMGLPVVASRTGGLAEVVVDERTGLCPPSGDVESLAEAAERLLADPDLRQRIARRAYQAALQRFTLRAGARRFDHIYQALLRRGPEATGD